MWPSSTRSARSWSTASPACAPFQPDTSLGGRMPFHRTTVGEALLLFAPEKARNERWFLTRSSRSPAPGHGNPARGQAQLFGTAQSVGCPVSPDIGGHATVGTKSRSRNRSDCH